MHTNCWVDVAALMKLPTTGKAWDAMVAAGGAGPFSPKLSDQDNPVTTKMLAASMAGVRKGDITLLERVRAGCMLAMGTEDGGRTLAAAREMGPLVGAADYANVRDAQFIDWVDAVLHEVLDGKTLISTHEDRPNNWGTHAGATLCASYLYLFKYGNRDQRRRATSGFLRTVKVFRGWLGDRDKYAGFDFGELDWQADPSKPVGINPRGATRDGHSIDGVLPDDQRRSGGFTWPPPKQNYVWEALQGAFAQAQMIHQVFPDVWGWSDKALERAVTWLHVQCQFPATGDDTWIPHLCNAAYGTRFPAPIPSSPGKAFGFTDWTHAST